MWGHSLISSFAGLVLSLVAPLTNTAIVAPAYSSSYSGSVDCSLNVSQSGVTSGTAAQITWSTSGASSATMSQDGSAPVSVALSGTVPVTITHNTTLSLTARNNYGGYKTCTATVTVSSTNSGAPSCGLSPTPGVHYAGQQVQLVWYTQNATAAQISNVGTVPSNQLVQGSTTVVPSQTTLYTMTVSNPSGSRTCSALVSINRAPTTSYQPVTTQQVTYRPTTSGTPSYSTPRSYPSYTYPSSGSNYSPGRGLGYDSYGNGSSYYSFETIEYPGSSGWSLTDTWNGFGSLGESFTVQSFPHTSDGGCSSWASMGSDGNCYSDVYDNPMADDYYNPGKYDYQTIFPGQSATDVIERMGDSGSDTGITSTASWSLGGDSGGVYYSPDSGTNIYPEMQWGSGQNDTGYYNPGTVVDIDAGVANPGLYAPYMYPEMGTDPTTNYGPQVWNYDYQGAETNYNWNNPIMMDMGGFQADTNQSNSVYSDYPTDAGGELQFDI